ncbi:type I glyceraldehyde-3-phosphate dehydrogenase [Paenibacillus plantarum]|uniref:type I glyceraldehyde-3-phosphate dehydrogenase n=1 Tax=Paenibacillus plantarum TaxID=2654975 RepID=UPI001FED0302|nr:type I glyceraldehyde-3-phosphate dehydrogenase [Paenibacillus plantarum]
MRVGISGTGRIGRLCIRKAFTEKQLDYEVLVINSTSPIDVLAHLLKYDSVHGTWGANIEVLNDNLIAINGEQIFVTCEYEPDLLPWREYGVELVVDATGKFNHRHGAERHIFAGAKRVVITAPGTNMDLTVVMGVNEERYNPKEHRLISAASCTTNCIAPILHILDEAFRIKQGWMTTVHAYTNDQNHMDNPHKDLRRARACTNSIIPTSSGVGKALVDVIPHLASHIQGVSLRVPTQDVSLLDLQVVVGRDVKVDEVKLAIKQAIEGQIGSYVDYNELPLVSVDYIGNEKSAVIDGLSIMVQEDQIKLLAWYDNEWGYANRVIDLVSFISRENRTQPKGETRCLTQTM